MSGRSSAGGTPSGRVATARPTSKSGRAIAYPGTERIISRKTSSGELYGQAWPKRRASASRISRSLCVPALRIAFLSACTCPQVLVTVPAFSAKLVAGTTTSARAGGLVRKKAAAKRKSKLPPGGGGGPQL